MVNVKVKRLTQTARLPAYQRDGDAGLDIYADQSVIVMPKQTAIIKTGVVVIVPPQHVGLVWDRGGMAARHSLHTLAGVLDENYRGELMIILHNLSDTAYQVEQGDRIAQLLVQPITHYGVEEVDDVDETVRNDGRFGSSGK